MATQNGQPVFVNSVKELPWKTVAEIKTSQEKGQIAIGIPMDSARQWLAENPDAPSKPRFKLNVLLFISGIGYPLVLIGFTWSYIHIFALALLIPAFIFFIVSRPIVLKTYKKYYGIPVISSILVVYGIIIQTPLLWSLGLGILGPWFFNNRQYRYAAKIVRQLVCSNQEIFEHFFLAGELNLLNLDTGEEFWYVYVMDNPLPPKWFFRAHS